MVYIIQLSLRNQIQKCLACRQNKAYHQSLFPTLIQRYGIVHTGFSIVLLLPLALVSISAFIELLPMLYGLIGVSAYIVLVSALAYLGLSETSFNVGRDSSSTWQHAQAAVPLCEDSGV